MRQSIDELMSSVNCTKWPQRWRDIYQETMDVFDTEGNPLTDPDYYTELANRYNILSTELETYQQAAIETGRNEALSRFLFLLQTALADADHCNEDLSEFSRPTSPKGQPYLAVDMLTGLALCSQMPRCYEILKSKKIPEDLIVLAMRAPEITVAMYRERHDGAPGFNHLRWYQRTIEGNLFRIGRIEIEINTTFQGDANVFSDYNNFIAFANGAVLDHTGFAPTVNELNSANDYWIANMEETPVSWIGYPYNSEGKVEKQRKTLDKAIWKQVLAKNDSVVSIHIPAGDKLDADMIGASIEQSRAFLGKYFPEYEYKAFTCKSWLINPRLEKILNQDSNILKFQRRFLPLTCVASGKDVLNFVFQQSDISIAPESLPENTHLQRSLKKGYLVGDALHEMIGIIINL